MALEDSILKTTKKLLGIPSTSTVFDLDVTLYINAAFSELNSLRIGPENGFRIEGSQETWTEYLGEDLANLDAVKTLVALMVKIEWDPPSSSYAIESMRKQIEMHQWRLNIAMEGVKWTPPVEPTTP